MRKSVFWLILAIVSVTGQAQDIRNKKEPGILTAWMDLHCQLVRKATGIPHVAFSRQFSYTSIAVYETIASAHPSSRSLVKQLNGLSPFPAACPGNCDQQLNVNAAYAEMLRAFYAPFKGCMATIDSMEKVQATRITYRVAGKKALENSTLFGKAVARHILQWANADGANNSKTYTPLQGEDVWTPATTAAAPFWSENRTLTPGLVSIYQMVAPLYASDTASSFYKMAKQVYKTGRQLSEEQRKIAMHWDDSPNGQYITVFGHWTSILSDLIKEHRISLGRSAIAFAKMTIALHEACIIAWKGKYQYNVVRPETYIRKHIDKDWSPLISTPPHPEFPAAHATLSYAAATILETVFGNSCAVTDSTYTGIGMGIRTYSSLQEAAKEAGWSRLYGGIHYPYSIEQSFAIGANVARFVDKTISFVLKE